MGLPRAFVGPSLRAHEERSANMEVLPLPEGCHATRGWKWRGSLVEGSDGGLYCAPFSAQGVLRVDPQSQSTSLLPLPDGCGAMQSAKWWGSLVAGSDGGMYCAPSCARGVVRLDCLKWLARHDLPLSLIHI